MLTGSANYNMQKGSVVRRGGGGSYEEKECKKKILEEGKEKKKKEEKEKKKENLEMPGIEPGASHMRSERSTTELHPQGGKQKLAKCAIYPLWLQKFHLPTPELAPMTSMAILGQ